MAWLLIDTASEERSCSCPVPRHYLSLDVRCAPGTLGSLCSASCRCSPQAWPGTKDLKSARCYQMRARFVDSSESSWVLEGGSLPSQLRQVYLKGTGNGHGRQNLKNHVCGLNFVFRIITAGVLLIYWVICLFNNEPNNVSCVYISESQDTHGISIVFRVEKWHIMKCELNIVWT